VPGDRAMLAEWADHIEDTRRNRAFTSWAFPQSQLSEPSERE
jgi:hypothetical protein